jgi:aminoglycoside phosphotransferase (APT) family kinase protein
MVTARLYGETILRGDPSEVDRIGNLLERGDQAFERSGSRLRAACIVHSDLHHGNVLTADRVYFIDWEYAHVGDPLFDLACIIGYYPRAVSHGALLLAASGLDAQGVTEAQLTELTRVFNLMTFLWYRARRLTRGVTATDLQLEATALRRMLSPANLAPGT